MKKRIFSIIIALTLCLSLLPVTAWAEETNLTIYVKSPSGQSATLTLAPTTTIEEVKAKIANEFSISFDGDDGYRLYCGDMAVGDYQLNTTNKTTLSDYSFKSGYTIHVEKSTWTATKETPIQIFGLTITGGVGAQEPYGSYSSADYYWNYYYKTITIRSATSAKNITLSGTAEAGTHIIINSSGWHYVTLDNVSLSNNTGGCITLNPGSWLYLMLEGNNTLATTGGNAPVLALNNTNSYLWIANSTGTLTATSTCANMPGIGTCLESDTVWGIVMKSGTITANGGEGAPGLRANKVQIDGGMLTAIAGSKGVPGVVATTGTISLGTDMKVVAPVGGAVQTDAYKNTYDIIAADADTIAKTVTVMSKPQPPTYAQLSDSSSNGTAISVSVQCTTEGSNHNKTEYLLKANSYTLGDVTWDETKGTWYCDVTISATPYITDYANTNGSHELASGESDGKTVRFWYTVGQTNPWQTEDGYSGTQRKPEFKVVDTVISRTITVTGTADSRPTQVTLNTAVIAPSGTGGAVTYAMSTENTAPADGWQTSTVFTGLTENTTYYFFAKVAASGNYAAAVSAGTPITTPAKAVSGIEVITQPTKLTYTTGETLDLTGLTVKVKYNDGSEETISDLTRLTTDPANGAALTVTGNNGRPVTITYGGQTCTTNNLTVKRGTQTALTITGVPEKIESGDSFTLAAEGGSGTGWITWSVVSGPAEIDQNGTVTVTGTGEITVKVVKAGDTEYEQTECSVTFTAVKKPSPGSSSSGNGSSVMTYPVTVEDTAHGTAKADRTHAASGTTVTITVIPDDGCTLDGLTVTDKNGREISVKDKGDGKYTFTMPAGKVTVSVTFAEISASYADCPRDEACPIWPFTDASTTAWYHDGVHYCIENGLMSGCGSGLFGPNDNLSRAQLAQIFYNKEGQPTVTGGSVFTDVADGAWYTPAVTWAAANGIVTGYGNGLFGPNDPITREQLAAMLWRYAEFKDCDTTQGGMIIREFSDYESISGYAMDAMTWAVNAGVIGGYEDQTLRPQATATRAQAAQMLKNFLENT